jgi:F-type H+-transporting ATPase subunit delta
LTESSANASGLAGRYALALFELAREQDALDGVAGDLTALSALYDESADLRRVVRSPALTREEQGRGIDAIAEKAGFSGLARQFLGLLAHKRRLFALPEVIEAFEGMRSRHRGEVSAELISAVPLSDDQVGRIKEQLSETAGKSVSLSTSTDPALLGGIVVRVGSRMIDASLRTKLHRLELAMKGTA